MEITTYEARSKIAVKEAIENLVTHSTIAFETAKALNSQVQPEIVKLLAEVDTLAFKVKVAGLSVNGNGVALDQATEVINTLQALWVSALAESGVSESMLKRQLAVAFTHSVMAARAVKMSIENLAICQMAKI